MKIKAKWLVASVASLLVGFLCFSGGCKLTPEQGKVIAQQTGLFSAVGWISACNPTQEQIQEVKSILGTINDSASKITAGQTYTEVVYPEVIKVINAKVQPKDRSLCIVAAMTLLNGLDTMFALYPEWNTNSTLAISIVNSYVNGAINGLSLNENSATMKQIRKNCMVKAKLNHEMIR